MKKTVFIVGLFYSVLALGHGHVAGVSSGAEISGQVTSKCTVKEAADDIFKTGVAPIDYQKMLAVKPSTDAVKIANDSFESTGQALQQIASVQEKLDKQKQDAIDAQNK